MVQWLGRRHTMPQMQVRLPLLRRGVSLLLSQPPNVLWRERGLTEWRHCRSTGSKNPRALPLPGQGGRLWDVREAPFPRRVFGGHVRNEPLDRRSLTFLKSSRCHRFA